MGRREQRRRQKRAEPAAEHPHWRLPERGVSGEEGAGGGVVSDGRGVVGRAAASALLSPPQRRAALGSSGQPGARAGVRECVCGREWPRPPLPPGLLLGPGGSARPPGAHGGPGRPLVGSRAALASNPRCLP